MTQQPAIQPRKTRILIAAATVFGIAAAWAWSQPARADAPLLRTATTETAAEAERMRNRILQRMQERGAPQPAPYGTGYEARKQLAPEVAEDTPRMERVERVERIERVERAERPERVERPVMERAGRGGR